MIKKFLFLPLLLGLFLAPSKVDAVNNKAPRYIKENVIGLSYSSRIEKYRQDAIASLVEVNLDDYRQAQQEEITSLKEETINKINLSEDYDEIDAIVSSYNRYILTIKTDAQMSKEEEEAIPATTTYYISSVSELLEFRDDVNSGYSYEGDTVILTNDITIPSGTSFGSPIGHTDSTPFSGTFDGGNYTISGFKASGNDSIALFSRVTGGTIKNLKMANVDVKVTGSQRGGAVVARANEAIIDNVKVLSGTITGPAQMAGVVGFAMNNTTIQNCFNAATISGKGTSVGGILGATHSDATYKIIKNCINEGNVTNTSDGTGGILGASLAASSATVSIIDCVNKGTINGRNYVGGVIGIAREANKTTSGINNCVNKADVVASGTTGIGGVTGFTRINITNCSIINSVLIKGNRADTYEAVGDVVSGTAGATSGKYGYITAGVGNGAIETGGKLLTESIGEFNTYQVNNQGPEYTNGRLVKLLDGRYLLASVSGYSIADNYGENAFIDFKTRTNSYGWDYIPDTTTQTLSSNFCPIQLEDGRIVIFYRTNPTETSSGSGVYYSSIKAIVSSNYGSSWTKYILFENYSLEKKGAYEPFPVIDGSIMHVYFACDIQSTRANDLGPDNTQFITYEDYIGVQYQNILRTTIDFSNNGFVIGSTSICIEATADYRRPGMPTITKLSDNSYAMVMEHNGDLDLGSKMWMVVAISYSKDLINWTTPKTIITPTKTGVKNGTLNYYRCGAPVVSLLPSGRIAVSYMTNEYYNGFECEDVGGTDDWFRTQEMAVSEEVVTYNSLPNMTRLTNVRTYEENQASCYGSCVSIDGKLIMISNNYNITSEGKRSKNSGLLFSVTNLY